MNGELRLKFENMLELHDNEIMQTESGFSCVNNKECYQILAYYNPSSSILNGTLYFNLGSQEFKKVSDFKFYNTIDGEFEFLNEFFLDVTGIKAGKKQIEMHEFELYPKGIIMDIFPLYLHTRKDGDNDIFFISESYSGSLGRIDHFIEENIIK